uniref:subtilisin n=1 Tax=Noctiluca scintillans TaxID=2966 RepID=A0A7S1AYI1_NOCSC
MAVLQTTLADLAHRVQDHTGVDFLELDGTLGRIPSVLVERDPMPDLWGLDRVDQRSRELDHHYSPYNNGVGVHVYVFDTGIGAFHRDFQGRAEATLDLTSNELVECSKSSDPACGKDTTGHGTHCAGIIGSHSFGVAKGAKLHGVKVLSESGYGQVSWFLRAADWVANHGERPAVVSASVIAEEGGPSTASAVGYLVEAGIPVVVAAGNADENACAVSPANIPSVVTVGSLGLDGERSWFSNYGPCVDLYAPGSSIQSLSLIGTELMSGTSTAAPFVAGAIALLLSAQPDLTPGEVSRRLLETATKSGNMSIVYVGTHPSGPREASHQMSVGEVFTVVKGSCIAEGSCLHSPGGATWSGAEHCEARANPRLAADLVLRWDELNMTAGAGEFHVNGRKITNPEQVTKMGGLVSPRVVSWTGADQQLASFVSFKICATEHDVTEEASASFVDVPRLAKQAADLHGNLVFSNTARTRRTVQGILSFDRALDESGAQHYEVYFGINETTKLENQSPLALIEVTTGSDDCGVKGSDGLSDLSEQIVNGKSAKKCEFRWQARISYDNEHYCGGSLISPTWVLTAAHCVETWTKDTTGEYAITFGDWDMSIDGGFRQVRQLRNVIIHDQFESEPGIMDYALIELDHEVEFNECAGAVCLPTYEVETGAVCEISGWGTEKFWFSAIGNSPGILQKAQMQVWSNGECTQRYAGVSDMPVVMPENICARGEDVDGLYTDACQGDSGGPMTCHTGSNRDGPSHTLEAIISWGIGCGSNRPGIYSRVSQITEWVNQITHVRMRLSHEIPARDAPEGATHLLVFLDKPGVELFPVAVAL